MIERPRIAPLGRLVARQRMGLRHEEVLHGIGIAAGPAQADHVPDLLQRRLRRREEHRPRHRLSLRPAPLPPVRLAHHAMRAEPCRVVPAAGEGPFAADPVPALDRNGLSAVAGAPGEDRLRLAAKNLLRRLRRKESRDRCAHIVLPEAPGRARVDRGDRLEDRREGRRIDLGAVEGARDQQAEQPRRPEIGDQPLRQPLLVLDLRRRGRDPRRQRPHPPEPVYGPLGDLPLTDPRRASARRPGLQRFIGHRRRVLLRIAKQLPSWAGHPVLARKPPKSLAPLHKPGHPSI